MIVEMGEDVVKEKDHLNYRYFNKRSFYMTVIERILSKTKGLEKMELGYEFDGENESRPILVLKTENFSIRILTSTQAFKAFRMAPGRNNVRSSVFYEQMHHLKPVSQYTDEPTPHINSAILTDVLFNNQTKAIKAAAKDIPAFAEGLKLLKAWHKQQNLCKIHGGITSFHLTMLLVLMAHQDLIDATMDEMSILKAALKFIGNLDLTKPLSLNKKPASDIPDEYKDELTVVTFAKHFECVFIDPTGFMNLFWNVRKISAQVLIDEARRHYQLFLQLPDEEKLLMMTANVPAMKPDVTLVFKWGVDSDCKTPDLRFDEVGMNRLRSTLEQALTNRVTQISIISRHSDKELRVELSLNPEECFRLTDLGPPIEDKPGCAAFRAFWGEKSELRRFKDSSIKEAAVWEMFSKERHLIVGEICRYALVKHCEVEAGKFKVICGQLDFATESGSFGPVISAFELLSKKIRGLKELPLSITGVEAISPACRYTSLPIPVALSSVQVKNGVLPLCLPVYDIIIRVEASGKWPQDPHAASLLKQAFALQLSRSLIEEHGAETSFAKEYLNVLCDDFIFRCYLTYAGEIQLAARHGLDTACLEEIFEVKPKHARAIHSLHTSNVVYGPAVRLAKRFISSQMLSVQVGEELVELLMAHVFLHPGRYPAPQSSWTAFLRFLQLLAQHDWEFVPLVVNFDASSSVKRAEIDAAFGNVREAVCMFVAPSYDSFKLSHWSLPRAQEKTLGELKRYSAAALKYLIDNPFGDLSVIFKRSLKSFDGTLELNLEHRTLSKSSQLALRNGSLQTDFLRYLPGFSPVAQLLQDLQNNFGKRLEFFYDGKMDSAMIAYRARETGDDYAEQLNAFCRDLIVKQN